MVPRADRGWDPHTSYHVNGTFHAKSHGRKFGQPQKRQSLTGTFRGTEHLGAYAGHGPKTVGAICDPAAFSGVVEVPIGILGPRDGSVLVDLVEPECEPISWPLSEAVRRTFKGYQSLAGDPSRLTSQRRPIKSRQIMPPAGIHKRVGSVDFVPRLCQIPRASRRGYLLSPTC
jgi:hypothetical protein